MRGPCRVAAEAWEAAFLELAAGELSAMAGAAGLDLSFSAERSVQDELARESYADLGTVRCAQGFRNLAENSLQCSAGMRELRRPGHGCNPHRALET